MQRFLNQKINITTVLLSHPLFATLSRDEVARLAARSRVHRFNAGQYLWHSGNSPKHLCLVVSGLLQTSVETRGGATSILELIKPGDVCGCLAHLHLGASLCDLRAVTDASVVLVPASEAFARGMGNPAWFRALAHNISLRFSRQISLRLIVTSNSRLKIPALLLWLGESIGATIPLTQAVIAMVAGINEATVCRALAPLKRRNLIQISRGVVKILSIRTLEDHLRETKKVSRLRRR